jgi:hypothetical protein
MFVRKSHLHRLVNAFGITRHLNDERDTVPNKKLAYDLGMVACTGQPGSDGPRIQVKGGNNHLDQTAVDRG